jgi:hypothetical protein
MKDREIGYHDLNFHNVTQKLVPIIDFYALGSVTKELLERIRPFFKYKNSNFNSVSLDAIVPAPDRLQSTSLSITHSFTS